MPAPHCRNGSCRYVGACSKMWLIDQLYIKLGRSTRLCTMYIPIFCSYKFKHNKAVLRAICFCLTIFTLKWGRLKLKATLSSDFLRRPEKLEEIVHLICFFTSLIRNLFFCQVSKKKKFKSGFLINQHSRLDELFAWSDEKKRFLSKGLHW